MESKFYFLLAVLQGITEFLPISSSGHLVLVESFLQIKTEELFFFNIIIHVATLMATMIFYRHDLKALISTGLVELRQFRLKESRTILSNSPLSPDTPFPVIRFIGRVALTTLVTGLIGITLKPWVEGFDHLGILALFFFLTGVILSMTWFKKNKNLGDEEERNGITPNLTIAAALIIGLAQGLAVFPGISRSGITITFGILWGLGSRTAMKYSILISIPVIFAAFLLEVWETIQIGSLSIDFLVYTGAFLVSFGVGYLSLHLLLKIVRQHQIHLFAFYLFPLALGLGGYFLFNP